MVSSVMSMMKQQYQLLSCHPERSEGSHTNAEILPVGQNDGGGL